MSHKDIRDGKGYRTSLNDGRAVYIDGQPVADVTQHKAFRKTVRSFAALYDFQADPANRDLMTFKHADGGRSNRAWQLPTSLADLEARRKAITAWSSLNFGFLGRSPDHVASTISAMAMAPDTFCFDAARKKAVLDYYDYASARDLFIAYVIQNPQADQSKSASQQKSGDLVLRIVDEDSTGITVRGAKMLGTSAIMADELFVGSVHPLKPDETDYAVSFATPMATKGLKLLSRKSYEKAANSGFDYPLSSRFDENDAIVYFDDARIPWDRVFVCRDTRAAMAQFHGGPVHIYQNYQSQIRLAVKLKFYAGLARRVAETNGIADLPPVRGTLSWIATQGSLVDALIFGMEAAGHHVGPYFVPDRQLLYAAQVFEQAMFPNLITKVREICGGGVIMLPSSADDLLNPDIAPVVKGVQVSPVTDPVGRIKTFKLAWDAVGSEFASRHMQYEMFYSGASHVTSANQYRTYDWDTALQLADEALSIAALPAKPTNVPLEMAK